MVIYWPLSWKGESKVRSPQEDGESGVLDSVKNDKSYANFKRCAMCNGNLTICLFVDLTSVVWAPRLLNE